MTCRMQGDSPFAAPVLGKVGGCNGSNAATEMHDSRISLQTFVIKLAVQAAVALPRKEFIFELGHDLHTPCGIICSL